MAAWLVGDPIEVAHSWEAYGRTGRGEAAASGLVRSMVRAAAGVFH